MKRAAAVAGLLAVALLVLPTQMTGDGTLAGQIRAFLSYGTGISLGLLSLMTIFVGASLVSNDIRTRCIFSLAVKPVARWQYIIGRWAGLLLFNTVLLAIACVSIYAAAQYLRTKETVSTKDSTESRRVSVLDRRAIETEIFAARRKVQADPIDMDQRVAQQLKRMRDEKTYDQAVSERMDQADGNNELAAELLKRDIEREILAATSDPLALDASLARRVAELKEAGNYKTALEGWLDRADGNRKRAENMLLDQLRREIGGHLQSIPPNGTMWWSFSDLNVAGREISQQASVVEPLGNTRLMKLSVPESFACRLLPTGPVKINGSAARVSATQGRLVAVRFPENGDHTRNLSGLAAGDSVDIVVEPVLQITYKITPTNRQALPDGKFMGMWRVTDGKRPGRPWAWLPTVSSQKAAVSMSSRQVGKNGKLRFAIHNASPTSAEVLFRDVALMYNVGTFESNFVRASVLMLCQLAFLSAVAVFAGSFVSFPVACLMCFVLGPFSLAREFLVTSVKINIPTDVGLITWLAHYIIKPFYVLMPDFARTMPGDRLIEGMDISWAFVGETALYDVLIRASAALLLSCLIFHRRELARVQV